MWIVELVTGAFFGMCGIKPIPEIVLAQAFNGLILPMIAIFLWMTMNDRRLLGDQGVNTLTQNFVMGLVVLTCTALGLRGLVAAVTNAARILG